MMNFRELIEVRRSRRSYTNAQILQEALDEIVQAGLLAPTGRNLKPNEIIMVRNKTMLETLSRAKTGGSAMLAEADAALVVIGDTARSDTWIEDGAITMTYMQLAAEEQGVGNCWVQIRNRQSQTVLANGEQLSSNAYVCQALEIPTPYEVLAILSLGMSKEARPPHTAADIDRSKLHMEKF